MSTGSQAFMKAPDFSWPDMPIHAFDLSNPACNCDPEFVRLWKAGSWLPQACPGDSPPAETAAPGATTPAATTTPVAAVTTSPAATVPAADPESIPELRGITAAHNAARACHAGGAGSVYVAVAACALLLRCCAVLQAARDRPVAISIVNTNNV